MEAEVRDADKIKATVEFAYKIVDLERLVVEQESQNIVARDSG